ncbi:MULTISPECIES: N-acetylglucosaminyltransferase [Microbulbifer]|uniref:N-acetylglucosaminyltransferase n=1 Tax=Microbulbifer TaxID=48073 RepID=UPI001E6255D0|nr:MULTISPECIES: N-acetylglucosaminyltransferase [Microbulbifer]UHQ54440.1 N-acetylglucosaminyltransferase [Microbulbifer sp. YPW16]
MSNHSGFRAVAGAMVLACWLTGCVTSTPVPAPRAVPLPEPAKPAGPTPEEIRQRNVEFFLARAEAAQRQGFLTRPPGASAFDYYLRVRQLDPDNRRAASGIQTIVIEFVERARDALRRRSFGEVNAYLNRADELAPDNPLVGEVRAQLARERSRASAGLPEGESVKLSPGALSAKSPEMVATLKDLAQRIRRENQRIIIIARQDAEGRWIYQKLREAVPGYRVRGDIKVGGTPQVILTGSMGGAE